MRKQLAQKQVGRSGRAVHQHRLRAVRQPAAGDRQAQARKATATVQRTPAPGATGALASAKLLDAVFGNDARAQQAQHRRHRGRARTSWPRRASSKYTPARTLPLAEVQGPGARTRGRRAGGGAGAQGGPGAPGQAAEGAPMPTAARQLLLSRAAAAGHCRVQVIDAVLRADCRQAAGCRWAWTWATQGYAVGRRSCRCCRATRRWAPNKSLRQQYARPGQCRGAGLLRAR